MKTFFNAVIVLIAFHSNIIISQDVEEVIIETGKTLDDFGAVDKPDGDPMGLSYNEFISPLVKAIQEQQEQIKILQEKIAALEGS